LAKVAFRRLRSIGRFGLKADLGCGAEFCDIVERQRRVVDVGGRGGQEKLS
jgi:hypothetical protein